MKHPFSSLVLRTVSLALALAVGLLAGHPARAEKPSWNDNDGRERPGHAKKHKDKHNDGNYRAERHFDKHHRQVIQDYYRAEFRSGHCPPGLAKKGNGCLPPGQAKKWVVGRPLPPEIRYYELPPEIIVRLGPPPSGYRYVRVAGDILLIATGTAMVMDAITDLSR